MKVSSDLEERCGGRFDCSREKGDVSTGAEFGGIWSRAVGRLVVSRSGRYNEGLLSWTLLWKQP